MKSEDSNVFIGMPSLLSGKRYEFDQEWPVNKVLPSPFNLKSEKVNVVYREHKHVTQCPHVNRKHYAKNMCKNCYIKIGRDKPAWICPHKERPHYAKGQCQLCYLSNYTKIKKSSSC